MSEAQLWLVAGVILFILEIITPGYVLANFGVAALVSALSAWLGVSLTWQIIIFIVVSLISFVTVRPILTRTMLNKGKPTPTGAAALVGRTARVVETIPDAPDFGRVQIDGDNWMAASLDGQAIEQGTVVQVIRVESIKLFVQRAVQPSIGDHNAN
jgi:membrane protein implicated in regulation of membrane protease activity